MAALLREGMEEILERERVAGYAYGDSSGFHVYLEAHPGSGAADRAAVRTTDATRLKGYPERSSTPSKKTFKSEASRCSPSWQA